MWCRGSKPGLGKYSANSTVSQFRKRGENEIRTKIIKQQQKKARCACLFKTMRSAGGPLHAAPTWVPVHLEELRLHKGLAWVAESKVGCVHSDTVLSSANSLAPTCLPSVIHGISLRIVQWVIAGFQNIHLIMCGSMCFMERPPTHSMGTDCGNSKPFIWMGSEVT